MDLCLNADTHHPRFIPFPDLDLSHLPERWQLPHVLQDIRDIAQRVVKLRVRKKSPDRFTHLPDGPDKKRLTQFGHYGTGFVTYDRSSGAVVHTSKHVIFDPFEAQHTDVIFFCDRDGEGVKCRGISAGFRTAWAMDYSSFTLQQPLPPEVVMTLEKNTEKTFPWRVFSPSRRLYRQSRDVDVIIISHPHGGPKKVSIGEMSRRHNMTDALYSATTCPGCSGAPVVRLSSDFPLYVAAGQFIHHGYNSERATGIGSLRPLVPLPYFRFLDVGGIRRVVASVYRPISYWALFMKDLVETESVLFNCTNKVSDFLTLYSVFCGWQDPWTVRLFWMLLGMVFCHMALCAKHGIHVSVLHMLYLLSALSRHWVTWLVCFLVPRVYHSLLWVTPLWLGVLFLSRQVSVVLLVLLGADFTPF